MKKDFKSANDLAIESPKEIFLDQLLSQEDKTHSNCLETISKIKECLSSKEFENSFDTLSVMKMRALLDGEKPVEAYEAIMEGLTIDPFNLTLHLQRNVCLSECHKYLVKIFSTDSHNPKIDQVYNLLLKEGYVSPKDQNNFLAFLIEHQRYSEAIDLAIPISQLYPGFVGLRERIKTLLKYQGNEILRSYVEAEPLRISDPSFRSQMDLEKTRDLIGKFATLQLNIIIDADETLIQRLFVETLGDADELPALDLVYKDLYFAKALFDEDKGRHWQAIVLLQKLVESDTCNLHFRNALSASVQNFCESIEGKSSEQLKSIDLQRIYPILKQIGFVTYRFLERVCLQEVRSGHTAKAKEKMSYLCSLNPYDLDYLRSALDVATEALDFDWFDQLNDYLKSLKRDRPWDPKLAAFKSID